MQPSPRAPGDDRQAARLRHDAKDLIVDGPTLDPTTGAGSTDQCRVRRRVHDSEASAVSGSGPGDTSVQSGSTPALSITSGWVEQHPDRGRREIRLSPPASEGVPELHVSRVRVALTETTGGLAKRRRAARARRQRVELFRHAPILAFNARADRGYGRVLRATRGSSEGSATAGGVIAVGGKRLLRSRFSSLAHRPPCRQP